MRSAAFAPWLACAAILTAMLAGCGSSGYVEGGSQSAGRQLFVERCGQCHALAEAGTNGIPTAPNLDHAFAQAREDGMTSATFTQVVAGQILYPISQTSTGSPGMPGPETTLAGLEDRDQAAADIATYVGAVAGTGIAPMQPGEEELDGQALFSRNCSGCHTLADADATGTIAPNLDQSRPSRGTVVQLVTNGRGGMPSFSESLSPQQIQAVAEYVSSVAGR